MRRDRQAGAHAHEPGVEPHLGDLRSAEIDRGSVKTQKAMLFGRSSTLTLAERIDYRAI
jgi:hypothetical protein